MTLYFLHHYFFTSISSKPFTMFLLQKWRHIHFKQGRYILWIYASIFSKLPSQVSKSLFSEKEYFYIHHTTIFCNISLIVAFKTILCTNMKNCNFDTRRLKILYTACMIYFLSHKLSFVIIFYFMIPTWCLS